ncbi:helix-turn-helix transcriptional regulator [Aminobacter sp. MDW-2]|uniref:helix-turn-helix domain-containing protein n=1 Tax=Aminobacter sp. MDW-2 TaxID=2666139 RepID=UPI0012B0960F|nr:helix-turn-helix transcriptional regulator [Aminobacter sp. MDW-2]MRX32782.1 helix-turn-helix domain-containing protein [Aminobacter sp. MDW-2]QNH34556.1 helix-turn-helix transcriptional regulator [Aminobacter sp. MDW-2]
MKHSTLSAADIDKIVGANIRRIRNVIGMSQQALGDALGVTFQQVQKYEKGTNRISAGKLYQSAEILGCNITKLFEGVKGEVRTRA